MSRREHFDAGAQPPAPMEWKTGKHTFLYIPPSHPMSNGMHLISAFEGDTKVSGMNWAPDTGRVDWIGTSEEHRGKGHATRLWREANRLAGEHPGVVAPVHSEHQTDAGSAWAKKVGGPQVERPASKWKIVGMA
jgi:hypothetical protein